ncbi:hypothetical protein PF008_g29953 [Phytophthora fragariae]|uniref:Alcohol dehydrogenase-like C-terminal domain-containing protein n=1 Tax=Phytophthora fragariae TaxID=53985 RepID=A0A6G0Q720_9STRA|nr:hypothetical protein PF008_g29953 [Phytophthora fragariae]
MDKDFLLLDSPMQDEVELKQEQEHRRRCCAPMVFTPSKEVGIKPGDRVGIVGIGGLGHLGIQIAKVMVAADVLAFFPLGQQ